MSSSTLLSNRRFNKLEVNKLEVNKLKYNSIDTTPTPFAGKHYRGYLPYVSIYIHYVFNENGDGYTLFGGGPTLDVANQLVPELKIFLIPGYNKRYMSDMQYNDATIWALERYIQSGMEFNEDYTELDVSSKIGGPRFALPNSNSPFVPLYLYAENPVSESFMKDAIDTYKFLLEDPLTYNPSISPILYLQN